MPIPIDKFDKIRNKKSVILSFLYENKKNAYTLEEIKRILSFDQPNIPIGSTLIRLKNTSLIDKEKIGDRFYYAISEYGIKLYEQNK